MSGPEQYLDAVKEAYTKGMEILNDMAGWQKLNEVEGVVGFNRENPDSPLKQFKVDFFIDKPPGITSRYLYDNYPALNEELAGSTIEFFRLKEKIGENMQIHHVAISPKGPVSGREGHSVCVYLELAEDTYAMVNTSIDAGGEIRPNYVESGLLVVTLFEPVVDDTNRCHLTATINVDPKGSVPSTIVNLIQSKRTGFYAKLKAKLLEVL